MCICSDHYLKFGQLGQDIVNHHRSDLDIPEKDSKAFKVRALQHLLLRCGSCKGRAAACCVATWVVVLHSAIVPRERAPVARLYWALVKLLRG